MGFFADQLILGLTDGAIFALVALGYTMVYGIIELINFAHGDIFTVGGFIGLTLIGILGLQHAPLAPLITAVGISFILEGILFLLKGPNQISYPNLLPGGNINLGFASIGIGNTFIILIALGLMIALNQFIQRTRIGRAMGATAQERDAARLMGININRTIAITFFIGSGLAAAGGIIYGFAYQTIDFSLGFRNGLFALLAGVLRGLL